MTRIIIEIVLGIALIGAVIVGWIEHDKAEQKIGITECQAKVDAAVKVQTDQNAADAISYVKQKDAADAQHEKDLADIAARIVTTPVFVRGPGQICSGTVSSVSAKTGNNTPQSGRVDQSTGNVDIRPELNEFEARIETVVADCRSAMAKWPEPRATTQPPQPPQ